MSFSADAADYKGITWRLVNPADNSAELASKIASRFPGLVVNGANSKTLTLSNVPETLNGWHVFCTFNVGSRRAATEEVLLTVTPAAAAAPAGGEEGDDGPAAELRPVAEGETRKVTGINCTFQYLGQYNTPGGASFAEIDFTNDYTNPVSGAACTGGMVDIKVSGNTDNRTRVDYWVINGVPYNFGFAVNSFRIVGLQETMTIEAVMTNGQPTTIGVVPEGGVSGEPRLVVKTRHAQMHHLDSSGAVGGAAFEELDFTERYTNQSSGRLVDGGHTDVQVAASIPSNQHIAYWKVNDMRWYLGDTVVKFSVLSLDRCMMYEPVFVANPQPAETPVPRYTVTCHNCRFSGGGYSGATSGTVPKGTPITVTGNGTSGTFSGSRSGHMNNGNMPVRFSYTVNSNCTFTFVEDIN